MDFSSTVRVCYWIFCGQWTGMNCDLWWVRNCLHPAEGGMRSLLFLFWPVDGSAAPPGWPWFHCGASAGVQLLWLALCFFCLFKLHIQRLLFSNKTTAFVFDICTNWLDTPKRFSNQNLGTVISHSRPIQLSSSSNQRVSSSENADI